MTVAPPPFEQDENFLPQTEHKTKQNSTNLLANCLHDFLFHINVNSVAPYYYYHGIEIFLSFHTPLSVAVSVSIAPLYCITTGNIGIDIGISISIEVGALYQNQHQQQNSRKEPIPTANIWRKPISLSLSLSLFSLSGSRNFYPIQLATSARKSAPYKCSITSLSK